jgi:hypothetical protein
MVFNQVQPGAKVIPRACENHGTDTGTGCRGKEGHQLFDRVDIQRVPLGGPVQGHHPDAIVMRLDIQVAVAGRINLNGHVKSSSFGAGFLVGPDASLLQGLAEYKQKALPPFA